MKLTFRPGARTVRCAACIDGDVLVSDQYETCSVCAGSGRHAPDEMYGVIDEDGGRITYDGRTEAAGSRGLAVLVGMNSLSHVYAGTVPASTVACRRAANKVARVSRRANRRSAR